MTDTTPEDPSWQVDTADELARLGRETAETSVQKGAILGALWGFALVVAGLLQFYEVGLFHLLRAPGSRSVYWTIGAGAAALRLSTERIPASFVGLACLASAEFVLRAFGLGDDLARGDTLSLLLTGLYVGALPLLIYLFVEAYRGSATRFAAPHMARISSELLLGPAMFRIAMAAMFGFAVVSALALFTGELFRGLTRPGAVLPNEQEAFESVARDLDRVQALGERPPGQVARRDFEAESDVEPVAPAARPPVAVVEGARRAREDNRRPEAPSLQESQRAAEQGDAEARNDLGVLYDSGLGVPQDYAEALRWYRLAAEQGNANAQNNLGAMYDHGRGVPRNAGEALRWYRLAAAQGNANAQNNLGVLYDSGRGVTQDYALAFEWYRRAAEQGNATAQCNLGFAYARGQGVARDNVQAHKWFNLAGAQGDEVASRNRDIVAASMTDEEIAEAQKLARAWKPGAASQE